MNFFKLFGHVTTVIILTVVTQIGGLLWVISILINLKYKIKKRYTFLVLYLMFNIIIIPPIAKSMGRVKLPVFSNTIKSRNVFYSLAFRNYVTPELFNVLKTASKSLEKENIKITYLDANFPFYNGFPLLPHRSHNDGKKIDISFMYKSKNGTSTNKKPSLSGYGIYVNNTNQTSLFCLKKGHWQYDFTKYLTFGKTNNVIFDSKQTKRLLVSFLKQPQAQKIFIEPYLKKKLSLSQFNSIRFHGCKAVRHDDHIHLQIK